MEKVDLSKLGAEAFEKWVRWCQRYLRWKLLALRHAERPGTNDFEFAYEITCNALLEAGVLQAMRDAFGSLDPEIARLLIAELGYIDATAHRLGLQEVAEPALESRAVDAVLIGHHGVARLVNGHVVPDMRSRISQLLTVLGDLVSLAKLN